MSKTPAANIERIRDLAARGLTRQQIADQSGMTYDQIKGACYQYGIDVALSAPVSLPRIAWLERRVAGI